jgi:hypothetical protein
MRILYIVLFLFIVTTNLFGQKLSLTSPFEGFENLRIYVDSLVFDTKEDMIRFNRKPHLGFEYSNNEQVLRAELYVKRGFTKQITLTPSDDFSILDSMRIINNEYFAFRVRFKDLSGSEFLNFTFQLKDSTGQSTLYELPLFPYTQTRATFYLDNDDLYQGEAKKIEIISNNVNNLVLDGEWKTQGNFEYRLVKTQNEAFLYLQSNARGRTKFSLPLRTKKPFLDSLGNINYDLPPIVKEVNTRQSRLTFLRMDVRDITIDPDIKDGIEIQLENNRLLQIGKTYRVEDAEQKGSPLIAEIFTKQLLSNDRVLCVFRPYRTHLSSEGYLYIKDGDTPMFITNVDITPRATIKRISILRNGGQWTNELNLKPGETVDLRIEGESLSKARYFFEDLEDISADTLTRSDVVANYRLRVPINISKTSLDIYNRNKRTGYKLQIVEHQRPRKFDFVYVNYGAGPKRAINLDQPILYDNTIKDIIISFDRGKIDQGELLYGKQHINIRVRLEDKAGNLLESRNLGNFVICPSETSPRSAFYREAGCRLDDILANSFLSRKTHSLDEWAKIEITIEHLKERYDSEGYSQRIIIHKQRLVTYDLEISFPAGLLTRRLGEGEGLSPFGGISLAIIYQFSFFKKDEIQRMQPYKVGAGILAQNAFNFNPDADRDLGLVVIGSVYPIRRGKLSFPIHGGFGYFLQDNQFFFLVGPGIQVNF